eukprot:418201-Heterocapsa_arctica.AAC.1
MEQLVAPRGLVQEDLRCTRFGPPGRVLALRAETTTKCFVAIGTVQRSACQPVMSLPRGAGSRHTVR